MSEQFDPIKALDKLIDNMAERRKIAAQVNAGTWAELVRLRKINAELLAACKHAIGAIESNSQHPATASEFKLRAAIRKAEANQ